MSEETPSPFAQLGLREELLQTLAALGYEAPTPIQSKTIPVLLAGRDLIGQAQTGTGKTAAFALPMLQMIDPTSHHTQALVLAPTRELAMQVAEAIHTYSRIIGPVTVLPVYGGAPMHVQLRHLERGAQIVVGTPGRLIDHLGRGTLKLDKTRMIVLDEADEMLRMGFIDDVETILAKAPASRQTALFSATLPPQIQRIAQKYLSNPEHVEIEHHKLTAPAIEQRFLNVSEGQKLEALTQILEIEENEAVLIFRRTKVGAAELAEKLEARGFAAEAMHGDMNQTLRESVIRRLRAGTVEIVVATDVAARGLDVEQISHVINYDAPHDEEVYVHRIGRTGRAGRSGIATLFITPRERKMMRDIERFTGGAIKPMKMPTRADVAAKRVSVFKESLRKNLEAGDLDLYVALVEQLVDEGRHDMAEVAAAAARLANGSRSLVPEPEPKIVERFPVREREERPHRQSAASPRDSGPSTPRPREGKRDDNEPKIRLSMSLGSREGIRPSDVVGSIANEANVPGKEIGPIEIGEEVTIVTIPAKYAETVLRKLSKARFRGNAVNLKLADDGAPLPQRQEIARDVAPRAEPVVAEEKPRRAYPEARPAPAVTRRAGKFVVRGDANKKPYGAGAKPYGASAKPYGASAKPYGASAKPYGAGAKKSEPAAKPYGAAKRSETGAKPHGAAAKKSDSGAKPFYKSFSGGAKGKGTKGSKDRKR